MLEPLLTVNFKNAAELQAAYLPFIKNGGLLLPLNSSDYELEQNVTLQISLWNRPQPLTIQTKVVWLAPDYAGLDYAGVGMQLNSGVTDLIKSNL